MSGIGMGAKLRMAGHRHVPHLREVGRPRRHLARQHLSRAVVRRAVAQLPVHLRAEPGLVAPLLARARDLGLPRPRRAPVRPARADVVPRRGRDRALGRPGVAAAHEGRRGGHVRLHRDRRRRAGAHQDARHPRPRRLRGRALPLGGMGSLGAARGAAHRRRRNGIDRDADHARARSRRRAVRALPAHAAVDHAARQPPLHALRQVAAAALSAAQQAVRPRLADRHRGHVRHRGDPAGVAALAAHLVLPPAPEEDQGPGPAPALHAHGQADVQAARDGQQVLRAVREPDGRPGRLPDRAGRGKGDPDDRRRAPRARRDRHGHRASTPTSSSARWS